MKITRDVKKISTETRDVPDHLFTDDSLRGRLVDVLVENEGMSWNGRNVRYDLHDDDMRVIDGAIDTLSRAYEKADKLIEVFNGHKD